MEKTGIITELKHFATHDGPGIRTTVFLKGCPLKCKWCSNPETINSGIQLYYIAKRCSNSKKCLTACSTGAVVEVKKNNKSNCALCFNCVDACTEYAFLPVGEEVSVKQVIDEVIKDMPFYGENGGITISGGEPLFQPEFCLELLKLSKESGISTVIDTSGYADTDVVNEIMQYTDMVLLDIKHMDSKIHKMGTGVGNDKILKNAELMAKNNNVRISFTLIPGYNDSEKNIINTAMFALNNGIKYIDINILHTLGSDKYIYLGLESPYKQYNQIKKDKINLIKNMIRDCGVNVTIGRMM